MQRMLTLAALVALLAGAPAVAQEGPERGERDWFEEDDRRGPDDPMDDEPGPPPDDGDWDDYRARLRERMRERFGGRQRGGGGRGGDRGFGRRGNFGPPGGGDFGGGPGGGRFGPPPRHGGGGFGGPGGGDFDGPGGGEFRGPPAHDFQGNGRFRGGPEPMPHGPDGDDRHVRRGRRGREGRQGRQGRDRPGIDQLMERVRQLDADLATELESTARQNPQEFRGYFARNVARQLGRLLGEGRKHGMAGEDGRKKVEEAALLELRTGLAGYRMRSMNEGERAGARAGLQKDLERLFDLKMELQQQRVKQTEEKLAELKKTLAARQKNRSSIVTGRMEDLVGQEDRFGW